MPARTYPINPIVQANVMVRKNKAYCARAGILPHSIGPFNLAFLNKKMSIIVTEIIANRTDRTCGIERRIRTLASTKYPYTPMKITKMMVAAKIKNWIALPFFAHETVASLFPRRYKRKLMYVVKIRIFTAVFFADMTPRTPNMG